MATVWDAWFDTQLEDFRADPEYLDWIRAIVESHPHKDISVTPWGLEWAILSFRRVVTSNDCVQHIVPLATLGNEKEVKSSKDTEDKDKNEYMVVFYNKHTQETSKWIIYQRDVLLPQLTKISFYPKGPESMTLEHRAQKRAVNQAFVQVIKQSAGGFCDKDQNHILVLESPHLLSAQILLAEFPSLTKYQGLCCLSNDSLPSTLPAGVRRVQDLFFRFAWNVAREETESDLPHAVDYLPQQGFKAIGYDACCTWKGAQGTLAHPPSDLAMVFARGLLHVVGGILWVTFSTRTRRKSEDMSIPREIIALANKYEYRLRHIASPTHKYSYGHPSRMVYFFFETF